MTVNNVRERVQGIDAELQANGGEKLAETSIPYASPTPLIEKPDRVRDRSECGGDRGGGEKRLHGGTVVRLLTASSLTMQWPEFHDAAPKEGHSGSAEPDR